MISTHIRTEGLYVKTTIIYQLKRLCVPDCAYTDNMLINSIHISLYDISLTQIILYQIKRDVAVWKRLGCPQRTQRTWWQIVATPYTGLALLVNITTCCYWDYVTVSFLSPAARDYCSTSYEINRSAYPSITTYDQLHIKTLNFCNTYNSWESQI